MTELSQQIRQLIDGSAPPVTMEEVHQARLAMEPAGAARRGRRRPGHGGLPVQLPAGRRRRHLQVGLTVVVVLLVAAAATVWATRPDVSRSHQAVRPSASPSPAPAWRLTASLSGTQFELATGNPDAVIGVTCSGEPTCFLSTGYGAGGDAGQLGSTYVSHDGGQAWQPSALPEDTTTTTLASCVTATWCAAGAGLLDLATGDPAAKKPSRDPELLVTTDAGATWTTHAVPIPVDVQQLPAYGQLPAETTSWPGTVDAVSCSAVGVCNVVGHTMTDAPGGGIADELVFLRTTDGGAHWTSTVLPERSTESSFQVGNYNGSSASSMSCPTADDCVVVSSLIPLFNPAGGVVDAWRTSDAGATWVESQVPGVVSIYPTISCPDVEDCWAGPTINSPGRPSGELLHSVDGGIDWSPVPVPAQPVPGAASPVDQAWQSVSCMSGDVCFVSGPGIAETTDGGASWHQVPLPSQVGEVPAISCTAQASCVAVANPASTASYPGFGGSLVLTDTPAPSGGSGAGG